MNNSASLLREAVLDDGCSVLQLVVAKLYRGSNLRPDFFFKTNAKLQQKKYFEIFAHEQRAVIERSGSATCYDISSAVKEFDISLLSLLAEHACGLHSSDPLLKKVFEVRKKRNTACHNGGNSLVTDAVFDEELNDLLKLYIEILDLLEERSYSDLSHKKVMVRSSIEGKRRRRTTTVMTESLQDDDSRAVALYKSLSRASPVRTSPPSSMVYRSSPDDDDDDDDDHNYSYSVPTTRSVPRYSPATNSSSEIPTWGKVALGVTAGIAALGLVGAAAEAASNNGSSEARKKRERRDDDCALM